MRQPTAASETSARFRAQLGWGEFERARVRRRPVPFAVLALAAANLVVYAVLCSAGGAAALETGARTWGAAASMLRGEWWRALTAAFVHLNLWHLGVNVALLAVFGARTERAYGSAAFAALYLLSAVAASLAGVWSVPGAVCIGASGAVFGGIGALLPYYLLGGRARGLPVRGVDAAYLSLILAGGLLAGLADPRTGNAAHLGGLACGIALGGALGGGCPWWSERSAEPLRAEV